MNKCVQVCTHSGWKHSIEYPSAKRQTGIRIYFSSVEVGLGSSGARLSGGGVGMAASFCLSLGTVPQHHCHVPPERLSSYADSLPLFTCSPLSKNSREVIESLNLLLQCNNGLCKIESWLWAGVNHSNLAHTIVLRERALCRIWMDSGVPGAWLWLRQTREHTKGQTARHTLKVKEGEAQER